MLRILVAAHAAQRPLVIAQLVLVAEILDDIRHWRIVQNMLFIETPTFTRLIATLIDDEEYSKLQDDLVKRPDAGDLIKDGGGIRKLRWKRAGTGKSGGIRVIYYWITEDDQILMLVAYPKSVKDNLSDK